MAKNIPVLLVTAPALKDVAKGASAEMLNVSKIMLKVVKCGQVAGLGRQFSMYKPSNPQETFR